MQPDVAPPPSYDTKVALNARVSPDCLIHIEGRRIYGDECILRYIPQQRSPRRLQAQRVCSVSDTRANGIGKLFASHSIISFHLTMLITGLGGSMAPNT